MGRRRRREPGERGLVERLLFSVMGPPQVGDAHAPSGYEPAPEANLCARCGRSYDEHERVHTGTMTYMRCPD